MCKKITKIKKKFESSFFFGMNTIKTMNSTLKIWNLQKKKEDKKADKKYIMISKYQILKKLS